MLLISPFFNLVPNIKQQIFFIMYVLLYICLSNDLAERLQVGRVTRTSMINFISLCSPDCDSIT